jgi:hypothetical protein
MAALFALAAAMLERRRKDRRAMLLALLAAVVLLFTARTYAGGERLVDYATSIAASFAGAALLGWAALRKPPKP